MILCKTSITVPNCSLSLFSPLCVLFFAMTRILPLQSSKLKSLQLSIRESSEIHGYILGLPASIRPWNLVARWRLLNWPKCGSNLDRWEGEFGTLRSGMVIAEFITQMTKCPRAKGGTLSNQGEGREKGTEIFYPGMSSH